MRCPVCVRYSCTCRPGDWNREVRRSFDAPARWARLEAEDRKAKRKAKSEEDAA